MRQNGAKRISMQRHPKQRNSMNVDSKQEDSKGEDSKDNDSMQENSKQRNPKNADSMKEDPEEDSKEEGSTQDCAVGREAESNQPGPAVCPPRPPPAHVMRQAEGTLKFAHCASTKIRQNTSAQNVCDPRHRRRSWGPVWGTKACEGRGRGIREA